VAPRAVPIGEVQALLRPRRRSQSDCRQARVTKQCHHSNKLLYYVVARIGHRTQQEVVVCAEIDCEARFGDLLRDPLIRLVMESDGVTDRDMIALRDQVRRVLAARDSSSATQSAASGSSSL